MSELQHIPENATEEQRKRIIKANREAWVYALKSGEYRQIQGALREDRGYCCLGVAEDLCHYRDDWNYDEEKGSYAVPRTSEYDTLTRETAEMLGFRDLDPMLDGEHSATMLNDNIGLSFSEIADLIIAYSKREGIPLDVEDLNESQD